MAKAEADGQPFKALPFEETKEHYFNPATDLTPAQAALWFKLSRERTEIPASALLALLERTKWDVKAIDYELAFPHRFVVPPGEVYTEPLELPTPPQQYRSTAERLYIDNQLIQPSFFPGQFDERGAPIGTGFPTVYGGQSNGQWPTSPQSGQGQYPGTQDSSPGYAIPPAVSGYIPQLASPSRGPMFPKPKPMNRDANGENLRPACDNCRRASKKCDRGRPCGRCIRYKYPHCGDFVKGSGELASDTPFKGPPLANLDPRYKPTVTRPREANYSDVKVYEVIVTFPDMPPIAVMRDEKSWINATHILQAARVDKGPRTRILARDIQTGEHEKVQGGFGKHQGTWIPLKRAIELAQEFQVYNIIRSLLVENEADLDLEP